MDLENCGERELFLAIERLATYMDQQLLSGLYSDQDVLEMKRSNVQLAGRIAAQVIDQLRYKKVSQAAALAELRDVEHVMEVRLSTRPLEYRVSLSQQ